MKKHLALALMAMTLIWSCSSDDNGSTPTVEAPEILDFTPPSGVVGTEITINGKNFSATASENTVKIGTATATVSSATTTKLVATVPTGATTGKVSVTVDGQTSTAGTFTVTAGEPVNQAPEIDENSLAFEASEDIADTELIGTIMATDPDEDDLTYEISANTENDLFVINADGEIRLAEGMELDYEKATELTIEVTVSDGTDDTVVEVTITVLDVLEPGDMALSPDSFIMTFNIPEAGFELTLGTNNDYEYDFTIDWGDGTIETITLAVDDALPTHEYATADEYTIAIQGDFPSIIMYLENAGVESSLALISMDQWGTIEWEYLDFAFAAASNMVYNATDVPNLSQVTSLSAMFIQIGAFNPDAAETIDDWDVSTITKMGSMFGATNFNGDISGWNVGKVEDMTAMFAGAEFFNQDLGDWDISSVTNMTNMFNNSGMSPQNFSNTVIDWSNQEVQQGVILGAEGVNFCATNEFVDAASSLINDHGWDISFGFGVNCQ